MRRRGRGIGGHAGRIVSQMDDDDLDQAARRRAAGAMLAGRGRSRAARDGWLRSPTSASPASTTTAPSPGHARGRLRPREDARAVRGDRRRAARATATGPVLLTRADEAQVAARARRDAPVASAYRRDGRPRDARRRRPGGRPRRDGRVVVVTAGTADLPVAGECEATLVAFGFAPTLARRLRRRRPPPPARLLRRARRSRRRRRRRRHGGGARERRRRPRRARRSSPCRRASATARASRASRRCSRCTPRAPPGVTVVGIDNGYGAACAVARILR